VGALWAEYRFAFKFGTPRLQEFQSWNRTGACNCASGPVLTTEIDHHNALLVPWQCHENPRSLSKSLHENSARNKYTSIQRKDKGQKVNQPKSSKRFQSHIDLEGLMVSTPCWWALVPRSKGCLFPLVGPQRSPPPPWATHWHQECSEQIFAVSTARHRSSVALGVAQPEAEPPAPQELSCAGRDSAHTSLDSPEPLGLASAHGLQESAPKTLAVPSALDYQAAKRIRISSGVDSIKQKWLHHLHVS